MPFSPNNAAEDIDNFIDTKFELKSHYDNFLIIGSLTSIAMARIHFLPFEMRVDAIEAIKAQLFVLESLHGTLNKKES